jgi:hypothetical protein
LAINDHLATARSLDQGNEAQQCAFARTGMPGDKKHFAFIDRKVKSG